MTTVKGRISPFRGAWANLLPLLEGLECAWMDPEGFNIGTAPLSQPRTTILWAWSTDRWARVRIGSETVIAALLDRSEEGNVSFEVRHPDVWSADDQTLPSRATDELSRPWSVLVSPTGLDPLPTFLQS